ncbi:MAG: hypothetical protein J7M14_05195 [Planctomycetes bacterium]|nr:hypothetical protein [Planctomycetota bacterium]
MPGSTIQQLVEEVLPRREQGIPLSIKQRKRWRIRGFVELSPRRRAGPRLARSQDDFFNERVARPMIGQPNV